MAIDWNAWAERATASLDMAAGATREQFAALFAVGGTYQDPVTARTTDTDSVFEITRTTMADWHMAVSEVSGDEQGGVMEWVGTGTLTGGGPLIELHGCSVVRVDDAGLVTRWRDYFDMAEFQRHAAPKG